MSSKSKFKKQLNEMLDAGVIMEVHKATPWINNFFIVETVKDGKKKLTICLDTTPLNKTIMHEQYITRAPDDVYHKLANAKYIIVIDFKKSFWQFVLDEESSYLTFNTPFGCYCYLRMPFSTNVSGDCHQQGIDSIYGKLDNVIGIADDLLIWINEEEVSDHDHTFQSILETTCKNNLKKPQKPLQAILSKSLVEATSQMQRLLLPTIPYDMTVEYIKGETNFIADCLSRAPSRRHHQVTNLASESDHCTCKMYTR